MRPPSKPRVIPAHLANSPSLAVIRRTSGEFDVWAPPTLEPPFVSARQLAGPFDTREEAEAWINDRNGL